MSAEWTTRGRIRPAARRTRAAARTPAGAGTATARATARRNAAAVVRRAPAAAELRTPALAVWAGEVLVVSGAPAGDLVAIAGAMGACGAGRVRVARLLSLASTAASAPALAAAAQAGAAVVVAAPAAPDQRSAVEALRRAVARVAPCRCVWLAPGRPRALAIADRFGAGLASRTRAPVPPARAS
jgi:hypothetical protein